jgi:hypothetical protein
MVLGAMSCPANVRGALSREVTAIKRRYGLQSAIEIKWTKVSPAKLDFYLELLSWFMSRPELRFRALVIDKRTLDHAAHNQTHDEFYYKQWFLVLTHLVKPPSTYRVYLDIKDTRSEERVRRLRNTLCNAAYDFDGTVIDRIQHVRSHQVPLLQVADLLTGTIACANKDAQYEVSASKLAMVSHLRRVSGKKLSRTTFPGEEKLNILKWRSRGY